MINTVGLSSGYVFPNLDKHSTESRADKSGFIWVKFNRTYDSHLLVTEEHSSLPVFPWFEQFKMTADSADTVEKIYPLVSGIADLFTESAYGEVDSLLADPEIDRFSDTALVTLVRTTFPARAKLTNWASCLEQVRSILEARGLDSEKLLRGLL